MRVRAIRPGVDFSMMTHEPMDPAERERLIDLIASDSAGIYGVEVCQLCGELGSYRGWADAMGSHWLHEFVPLSHGHVAPDNGDSYSSDGAFLVLERLLDEAPDRFCEVCLERVPRDQVQRRGYSWLCRGCDPAQLDKLARRRYVERKTDEEIRRWANVIESRKSE